MKALLPMSKAEMDRLGWSELDVLLITGDAYVDHPAFGAALLGRWLAAHGYRVGIVAQPRWDSTEDATALGRPRLFAGVTAGSLDSMLAHYTAFRKKRSDDAYTPGGRAGARPNRATIVYTNLVRTAFPKLPVVIGGVEASLRRATHYDFWSGHLRRSILLDAKADLLVYGMAERALLEIANRLSRPWTSPPLKGGRGDVGLSQWPDTLQEKTSPLPPFKGGLCDNTPPNLRIDILNGATTQEPVLHGIPGTAFVTTAGSFNVPEKGRLIELPSHEQIEADPKKLMTATLGLEQQVHSATWAVQSAGKRNVVFAPPSAPLTTEELDVLYALPFTRCAHPSYKEPIPAMEMIRFSVTTHRGCAGGCSFCSLALHQGRRIQSRSRNSILKEVKGFRRHADWKGSLSDIGGPSANMWGARCGSDPINCKRSSCLYPAICRNFKPAQQSIIDLLTDVGELPGVRHVRVASGIRHDLALLEPEYLHAVAACFTGGQLKVAPEHICANVLRLMRKPAFETFLEFMTVFERESRRARKEQYLIPYLMSAFPGCTDDDMRELALWLRSQGWRPQQVQCFIPTPGTVATAMYYAGIDPEGNPIHVARTDAERMRQHYILVPPPKEGTETAGPHKPAKKKRPESNRSGR